MLKLILTALIVILISYGFNKFKCEQMNMDYKYLMCVARGK